MRNDNVTTAACVATGLLLALILLLASCSTIRRAQRHQNDPVVRELLESYYITRENPENNLPGEQDSVLALIRKEIKK